MGYPTNMQRLARGSIFEWDGQQLHSINNQKPSSDQVMMGDCIIAQKEIYLTTIVMVIS